jgi:hypothetical protein
VHIDNNNKRTYFIESSGKKREVQSGGTYVIPAEELYSQLYINRPKVSSPIRIVGGTIEQSLAQQFTIDNGPGSGNYIALILPVQNLVDTLMRNGELCETIKNEISTTLGSQESDMTIDTTAIEAFIRDNYVIETKVKAGDKQYVVDVTGKLTMLTFIKTDDTWNNVVDWTVYAPNGEKVFMTSDTVPVDLEAAGNAMLPLLWAAKYTLREALGDLGATYGFIDGKMSLLALESDSIPADEAGDWKHEGVPPLLPEEIIVGSAGTPKPPEESALFEYSTGIAIVATDHTRTFMFSVFPGNIVCITLNGLQEANNCTVMLFDLQGRLVFRLNNIASINNRLSIQLPRYLKGTYLLRLMYAGKVGMSEKIMLH